MTLQTELGNLWEQYKKLLETGTERTDRVRDLEAKIHEIQKTKGYTRYDFDTKWAKKIANATPSVTGGTKEQMDNTVMAKEDIPVPTANFTLEQAQKRVGQNNLNILEDCVMDTEAEMICMEDICNRINPNNKSNVARRGQSMNLSEIKFRDRKSGTA